MSNEAGDAKGNFNFGGAVVSMDPMPDRIRQLHFSSLADMRASNNSAY